MDDEGDEDDRADRANGNVEQVIAKGFFLLWRFAFNDRFIVRTEDFTQKWHASLRKQNDSQTKNERRNQNRLA